MSGRAFSNIVVLLKKVRTLIVLRLIRCFAFNLDVRPKVA